MRCSTWRVNDLTKLSRQAPLLGLVKIWTRSPLVLYIRMPNAALYVLGTELCNLVRSWPKRLFHNTELSVHSDNYVLLLNIRSWAIIWEISNLQVSSDIFLYASAMKSPSIYISWTLIMNNIRCFLNIGTKIVYLTFLPNFTSLTSPNRSAVKIPIFFHTEMQF